MRISVVIPNYNGQILLKKNLPKVLEAVQTYRDGEVEVIIIDDASSDESIATIQQFSPAKRDPAQRDNSTINNKNTIKIIQNDRNLGFTSTVNKGVSEARGEIVVLLNTDVAPERNFLEPLIKRFSDSKVFAVGCLDKSIEKGKVVLRGRGLGKFERGFLVHRRGEVDKTDTLWVSGGSGAFRKSIWGRLGGFDSLYNPFYYEDIDLSYRALKSGYKILFEPKSVVVHEHESGAIKSHYSDSKIRRIAYRNQFIFVWKNITDLDKQLLHIFWLPYHLVKAIIRLDLPFFLGFLQTFIQLPKIIQSSFQVQKLFIKKDSEILG